jgi:hypothetical protein
MSWIFFSFQISNLSVARGKSELKLSTKVHDHYHFLKAFVESVQHNLHESLVLYFYTKENMSICHKTVEKRFWCRSNPHEAKQFFLETHHGM